MIKQKNTIGGITVPEEVQEKLAVERFYYDNKIVKLFAYATVFWGAIGMLAGLLAAIQLYLTRRQL
jgi:cytochrome c oxidase cbb3-type subunit I/II